ncbi:mRNA-decapping enzyme 1B [Tupaia chinensis]|uniref:mRNA-decapping enzyme 1B n=1 Tax=Tupaia chinensis TaxID=246437 RepID=L8YE00_TUPCH|nr:mRNA-decapping enzyme 1B [Tupaia chinensis]
MILSSGEGREVDILRMLTKAKDEYTKLYFNGPLPAQTPGHQAPGGEQPALVTGSSGVVSPRELLQKLQLVQQEQQLHASSSRPALAARFSVAALSSRTGKPLESWINKTCSTEKQTPLFQVTSPQRIPATVAPSLLMSPMVFTQSTSAPPKDRAGRLLPQGSQALSPASSSLLLPPQSPEPTAATSIPLTKLQLQEALLHLVQNDDSFLNIIYEAYLFSMTQAAVRETV